MGILSFADVGTRDVYNGVDSRVARRTCPVELFPIAARKLDQLAAAVWTGSDAAEVEIVDYH